MSCGDAARSVCSPWLLRPGRARGGCSGRPPREGTPGNATNQGQRCHFPRMDAHFSELPWLNQAPLSNPREYYSPVSMGKVSVSVDGCRAGPGEHRAESPNGGITGHAGQQGRRNHPNKEPPAQKCPSTEEKTKNQKPKRTKPQTDFNRLTMQMYSSRRRHFWL